VIPKPQDSVPVFAKPAIAHYVVAVFSVLAAIDLDDESMLAANQINYVWTDRLLSNEFASDECARPQAIPKPVFRIRGLLTEFS
jgi:hypothetical protein